MQGAVCQLCALCRAQDVGCVVAGQPVVQTGLQARLVKGCNDVVARLQAAGCGGVRAWCLLNVLR